MSIGAQWLLHQPVVHIRKYVRFRLRHRLGKSRTVVWTVPSVLDSITPDNNTLITVEKFGRGKGRVPATIDCLSIDHLTASDINHTVLCVYRVNGEYMLGILRGLDGSGPDASCKVSFPGITEEMVVRAKFLVRATELRT